MKRTIFDTSVYGRLAEDKEFIKKLSKLIPNDIVLYGAKIIRSELRDTPPHIKDGKKSKRIILLSIYDLLVGDHDLNYNRIIDTLANDYFIEYRNFGGNVSNDSIKNDLVIIATATIYHLDIVVSNDKRTMLSKAGISAYKKVNKLYSMECPTFLEYGDFRNKLERIKNGTH